MTKEEKAVVFLKCLTNAYKDEKERVELGRKLDLIRGNDIGDDITAIMLAMMSFFDQVCRLPDEYSDLVGFTHMLNRLAIQACEFEN